MDQEKALELLEELRIADKNYDDAVRKYVNKQIGQVEMTEARRHYITIRDYIMEVLMKYGD